MRRRRPEDGRDAASYFTFVPNATPLRRVDPPLNFVAMNRFLPSFAAVFMLASLPLVHAEVVYQQDFTKADVGSQPDELLILDGQFAVQEAEGNRFFELPGAPLESYGFLFGPSAASDVQASARIFSTKQGRKFPTFGIGLCGASGYRLQVSPAKKSIELFKGDTVVTNAPFDWKSGEWTQLRLQVRKVKDDEFKVEGKAWNAGTEEPKEPTITLTEPQAVPAGKAGAWGMPFAGTPIRFDDLKVTKLP